MLILYTAVPVSSSAFPKCLQLLAYTMHVLATSQCVDRIPVVFAKLINVLCQDHGHVFLMMAPGQFLNTVLRLIQNFHAFRGTSNFFLTNLHWFDFKKWWRSFPTANHQNVPFKTSSHRSQSVWPKDWALNRPIVPASAWPKSPCSAKASARPCMARKVRRWFTWRAVQRKRWMHCLFWTS